MALHWHVTRAARVVRAGGVIAYPTESVYGLGCDPWDAAAVVRILALKRRSPDKGLIVIAASRDQLTPYLDAPAALRAKLTAGRRPVTWLIPAPGLPPWIRGSHDTAAVRIVSHPAAAALCRLCGPLVSTSANLEGGTPARSALRVRRLFGDGVDYVLNGAPGPCRTPSEIRDARTGAVVRPGGR